MNEQTFSYVLLLCAALLILPYPRTSTAQDAKPIRFVQRELMIEGRRFQALVDPVRNVPHRILDPLQLSIDKGTPLSTSANAEVAARRFVDHHSTALGVSDVVLSHARVRTDGELWFVDLYQSVDSVQVLGAILGISFDKRGFVHALGVDIHPKVLQPPSPSISPTLAIANASAHAGMSNVNVVTEPTLTIVPLRGDTDYTYSLSWYFLLEDLAEADLRYFLVDAVTGLVIADEDLARSSSTNDSYRNPQPPAASFTFFGPYSVYGAHRFTSYLSPDSWNTFYEIRDNNALSRGHVMVRNNSTGTTWSTFANAGGSYTLSGLDGGNSTITFRIETPSARILSENPENELPESALDVTAPLYVSGSHQYNYDWNTGASALVHYGLNAVHHATLFYDWINSSSINYAGMVGVQMPILIRSDPIALSRGFYLELGGSAALSSEIVYHEAMHSVIFRLYGSSIDTNAPTTDPPGQASAMNEAIPDYFAASFDGHHYFGGPRWGDNSGPVQLTLRDLNNTYTMADWYNTQMTVETGYSPHLRGRILSGALWDVRESASGSPSEINRIAFKALEMSPQPRSFYDYRLNLLAADYAYYGGAHAVQIHSAFDGRGITNPASKTDPYDGDGPKETARKLSLTSVYPNPIHRNATVSYSLDKPGRVRLSVFDVLGRELVVIDDSDKLQGFHSAQLDARGLPRGVYFCRLVTRGVTRVFPFTVAW